MQTLGRILCFPILFAWGASSLGQDSKKFSAEQISFFENKIRPILVEHCYECHSQGAEKHGELWLDTQAGMLRGGVSGPAVVPRSPKRSLLLAAIRYNDPDLAMPPKDHGGKLPDSVIADFERWINMGAPDPRGTATASTKAYGNVDPKTWWAYQPIKPPSVPQTRDSKWPRSDIDRFVLAELEKRSMKPVALADDAIWLRRVYLDLIGLPPSLRDQKEFLTSRDPKRFEIAVSRLLNQPQFGERWGRHWLDVARYAETTGRDLNLTMPEAWRYRDYVIQAFNEDKPFDEFIIEQIAGDRLKSDDEKTRVKRLIATGFLAVGPKGLNETDPRQFAVDLADEQIDAVSQAFLGVTVSCARCHDHKFDPITQVDYTGMAGIFLSTDTHFGTPGGVRGRNASNLIEVSTKAGLDTLNRRMDPAVYAQKKSQLNATIQRRDEALRSRGPRQKQGGNVKQGGMEISGFDIVRMITRAKQLEVEISAFHPDGSARTMVMGASDRPNQPPVTRRGPGSPDRMIRGPNASGRTSSGFETIADSPLFLRGSIENEADTVPRGVPEFLSHGRKIGIANGSSGRLELARWIASKDNTLTSRVIVNRVWHWLFGKGLVESVDNFGVTGTQPSNQALLDFLASRFVEEGWSIKQLIREIVLSRVYQLDSRHDETNFALDPSNRLCWRSNGRRLDAETIRDCILAASGQLDFAPVCGSVIALAGDGPVGGDRFQAVREETIATATSRNRSVYLPIARSVQPEPLSVFDFTDPNIVLGARDTTIVPPQALYLMNGALMDQQAKAMAEQVMTTTGFDKRFVTACKLTYCREPYPDEVKAAKRMGGDDLTTWTSICRALLSSAEFLFVN